MSNDPVISAKDLSKSFPIYEKPADLLYELVTGNKRHDVFAALQNVSFDVHEGQRLGIIGPNGAGKSTLLKIITGNLPPTSGTVTVNGTVSSMLSLTSYLNAEETGLANIKFNLQVKGVPEKQIPAMTEEIVDFTELGGFIRSPVKTYSSGMNARLSFAIATALTPEILVVDEVLGVGDGYFVGKATERMVALCEKGRALLYVSHSMNALQRLCDTAIWLDKGVVRLQGPVDYVTKCYEEDFRRREDENLRSGNKKRRSDIRTWGDVSEFEEFDQWRLRLVSGSARQLRDTHYVTSIEIDLNGTRMPVSLEFSDTGPTDQQACLDILDSEWGRSYERNGRACRVLTATTGKRLGGHILIRKPPACIGRDASVVVRIRYSSATDLEELRVDCLQEKSGDWEPLAARDASGMPEEALPAPWRHREFEGQLTSVDHAAFAQLLERARHRTKPDVVIEDAYLLVGDERSKRVVERSPFRIVVRLQVERHVPCLDVGARIFRSDGVYVFWQSTGQTSGNISAEPGVVEAVFHFTANPLGSGEYHLSVYAANGWDIDRNYPYSEVFDRRVNVLTFSVVRENSLLDAGLINQLVETQLIVRGARHHSAERAGTLAE